MLGALSRADVFVPRWGSRGPNAFHPDSPPDDGVAQLVNASDIAERVVEGIDVIAGLVAGTLDAQSFRRDWRQAFLVNPAVAPRGGA